MCFRCFLRCVGTPANILESIALGIDMFDCVMPTRNGRNGMLFTAEGIINIKNKKWETDFSPIDISSNAPKFSFFTAIMDAIGSTAETSISPFFVLSFHFSQHLFRIPALLIVWMDIIIFIIQCHRIHTSFQVEQLDFSKFSWMTGREES